MVIHRLRAPAVPAPVDFDALRAELDVPGPFPPEVLEEAARAAASPLGGARRDARSLELVTVDPPGARDLDQAVAVTARPGGWRVSYAIADVAAVVVPGGPVDREAWRRTQTHYAPDRTTPLHPPVLSEGSASLLPDQDRAAVLWTIDVDDDGRTRSVEVERATVRSRAQLTYAEVQQALDRGEAPGVLRALPELGAALLADARRRDAIDLGLPEQEVVPDRGDHWTIRLRADLPVEIWNAQISLLTGRAAAQIMLDGGAGVLRTLPSPDPQRFPRFVEAARGLGIPWADAEHPGDVLARLDTSRPRHAALAELAAELLRGAGYTAVDGSPLDDPGHAGVGAPYAHVTAPLRRLVDRIATEACLAHVAGTVLPEWVLAAIGELPATMTAGDQRARALDRACIDVVEAFVLADRVGETFPAAVLESWDDGGNIAIDDPAIRARCDGADLPLGGEVVARCTRADVAERVVRFERVS
ncbi:RNB domain-containing ribonuclease [Actinomarinicola tropica]|uniref:RNB domain-containing ribonuclease n=1 Tax=Actinomarinicola tropica TaxID=2789776 RepID=A0A5Q2RLE6_9ACTN|nr:RNB domain-containing ribonuclease [Actinomarinicola tropica]QGG95401.1 RNB domain-containing ribonuclease [Actinomarinicola tropica]